MFRFTQEPKHVGVIVGILIVFNIPMILKLCASVGIINSIFDTIIARCKHENYYYLFQSIMSFIYIIVLKPKQQAT